MFNLFKFILYGIISIFFSSKDEINILHKKFNPVKVIAIILFFISIILNFVFMDTINSLYEIINNTKKE